MSVHTLLIRIRHAVFGRPLTHEEARARHEAEVAVARSVAGADVGARAHAVQSQTYWGL